MSTEKTDIPDTPPEVLARKPRALTAETSQLRPDSVRFGEDGKVVEPRTEQSIADTRRKVKAAELAEAYAGGEPLFGLDETQIRAIKSKNYPGAPKMNVIGDRYQPFVDWLWNNHPEDAKVRYAYRNVWPETFKPVIRDANGNVAVPANVPLSTNPVLPRRRGPNKKKAAIAPTTVTA